MNRSKTAAMGATVLPLLLAIAGCGQEGAAGTTPVSTVSSGAGGSDDKAQATAPPAESSPVVEDPADLGLTVAAGIHDEALRRCSTFGLTAEDIAPAGVSELAMESQFYDNHTICVYRIAGQQYPAHHALTVGFTRGEDEDPRYTLREGFEMSSKHPDAVPVAGLGEKAFWTDSLDDKGFGHRLVVLKGEEMLTIFGSLEAAVLPQDPEQDFYIRLAEKLLPKL